MIRNSYLHLFTLILLCVSNNHLLPKTNQIDSLINSVNLQSDISYQQDLYIKYEFLNYSINKLLLHKIPDSLFLQLKVNYLSQDFDSRNIFHSSMSEQWRINEQLTNYLQFNKELALKSELGVFSSMLRDAETIAAIILAILHVIKYKKTLYQFPAGPH